MYLSQSFTSAMVGRLKMKFFFQVILIEYIKFIPPPPNSFSYLFEPALLFH